jgi:hypothetical protein
MEAVAGQLLDLVGNLSQQLERVSEKDAAEKPSAVEWSNKEILGHLLLDAAANNHQRFVRAQLEDGLFFPGDEQADWVRKQNHQSCPWLQPVHFWRLYNLQLSHAIRQIPPERLHTTCRIGSAEAVTLGVLTEAYLVHLRSHVQQLGD